MGSVCEVDLQSPLYLCFFRESKLERSLLCASLQKFADGETSWPILISGVRYCMSPMCPRRDLVGLCLAGHGFNLSLRSNRRLAGQLRKELR